MLQIPQPSWKILVVGFCIMVVVSIIATVIFAAIVQMLQ